MMFDPDAVATLQATLIVIAPFPGEEMFRKGCYVNHPRTLELETDLGPFGSSQILLGKSTARVANYVSAWPKLSEH